MAVSHTHLERRPDPAERLPRCCPHHTDWPALVQHLADDFPDVGLVDIVREVRAARDATATADLSHADAMETGELIARHHLMLIAGHVSEVARLDPERHVRGRA